VPSALDRSGRGADTVKVDFDESNNSLAIAGASIVHGHP
jgi:hypothetical protein